MLRKLANFFNEQNVKKIAQKGGLIQGKKKATLFIAYQCSGGSPEDTFSRIASHTNSLKYGALILSE